MRDTDVLKHGRERFLKLIENPQSLFDRVWEIAVRETEPHDTPERRAGLKVRLLEMVATVSHPDVRAQYRKMLLDRYDATYFPRRPAPVRPTAKVVAIDAFLARRELPADDMELLTRLSRVEDDLAKASRLLVENWSEAALQHQQDLLKMKADIQREIVEKGGAGA